MFRVLEFLGLKQGLSLHSPTSGLTLKGGKTYLYPLLHWSAKLWFYTKDRSGVDRDCHTPFTRFCSTLVDRMPVTSARLSTDVFVRWPSFTTPASMKGVFRVAEENTLSDRKSLFNRGSSNSHIPGLGSGVLKRLLENHLHVKAEKVCFMPNLIPGLHCSSCKSTDGSS